MRALHALAMVVQDSPQPSDNSVLYTSITAVLVALIGGAVAIITSGRRAHSQTQEPNAELPRNLVELIEQSDERDAARIRALEADRDLWMQRAYSAGWRP